MSLGVRSHYDVQVSALETDSSAREGSSVTLTVGGDALDKTIETGINEVAYRKHSVNVSVTDMMDYYLVLAGDPNLTLQTTQTYTVPTVESNVVGAEMPENRWGFAWEKEGSTEAEALTYQPITTANTTLESDNALASESGVNFSGQLNFAARFGDSAALGKYTSKVSLSLIATPRTVSTVAQWKNTAGDPIGAGVESGTMQGIEADFCSNPAVKENYTIELKDARDGNMYTIVKLKDGKCWMQQNLRLVAEKDEGLGLTENDTDINGNWTLPKTLVGTGTSVSGWVNDNNAPYSATFNNVNYGTYYNWCAATAGTCTSVKSAGQVATGSVCPKGWHLPTGGSSGTSGTGEFSVLNGLNFSAVQQSPYSFLAAGNVFNGSFHGAGSDGDYWSSTASSDTDAYNLNFASSYFYPGTNSTGRYIGFSVRCVADASGTWKTPDGTLIPTELEYMQDITKANFTDKYCSRDADNLVPVGSIISIGDNRDNKYYTTVKLADGNCWMQENLALSGSRTLTSADSDVAKAYILPANTTNWNSSNKAAQNIRVGSTSLNGWEFGYGNYYSWQTATANTAPSGAGTASDSICPRGWKLPTGGGRTDITQFNTLFGDNSDFDKIFVSDRDKANGILSAPYKFFASGDIDADGNYRSSGSYGSYWSRVSNEYSAYMLTISTDSISPGTNYSSRIYGYSVRCVAQPAS